MYKLQGMLEKTNVGIGCRRGWCGKYPHGTRLYNGRRRTLLFFRRMFLDGHGDYIILYDIIWYKKKYEWINTSEPDLVDWSNSETTRLISETTHVFSRTRTSDSIIVRQVLYRTNARFLCGVCINGARPAQIPPYSSYSSPPSLYSIRPRQNPK